MESHPGPIKRFEEYAYVLDFTPRGRSQTVRGREGIIITAIGEEHLTMLELLGTPDSTFEIGERVYIGREGRTKVLSVLGKMKYDRISNSAQGELARIVEMIVTNNEERFVNYLNNVQALTPRVHALELIPGIGKTYMKTMLEERELEKFKSFADLQERVGLKSPVAHITERILEEIIDAPRMKLFVKK